MVALKACSFSLLMALSALSPMEPTNGPSETNPVTKIGHWNIECNDEPRCIAVGVLPPRKARMKGTNAALEIEFTHPRGISSGLTLLPLDGSIPLRQVRLSRTQAEVVLQQLMTGNQFLIWVTLGDDDTYYVPGQGFAELVGYVQQTMPSFAYPVPRTRVPISSPQVKGMQLR
jgi:hypothetical protein